MTKVATFFVSCKSDPKNELQFWVPHMCLIYSHCAHCETPTGIGQADWNEHYNLFEIVVKKDKGMDFDDVYDLAKKMVEADRTKYQVEKFSHPGDLIKKRVNMKK